MLRTTLATNIRKLRKEAGMTQEQLGHWLEVTNNQISAIEQGRSLPDAEQLFIMSQALGIDDMNLFYEQEGICRK